MLEQVQENGDACRHTRSRRNAIGRCDSVIPVLSDASRVDTEQIPPLRSQQQRIQSLEAQLSVAQKRLAANKALPPKEFMSYPAEMKTLKEANRRLREDKDELREELEELRAMVELLKGEVSGRQSLVSDPRASPFLGPALSLQ